MVRRALQIILRHFGNILQHINYWWSFPFRVLITITYKFEQAICVHDTSEEFSEHVAICKHCDKAWEYEE